MNDHDLLMDIKTALEEGNTYETLGIVYQWIEKLEDEPKEINFAD